MEIVYSYLLRKESVLSLLTFRIIACSSITKRKVNKGFFQFPKCVFSLKENKISGSLEG